MLLLSLFSLQMMYCAAAYHTLTLIGLILYRANTFLHMCIQMSVKRDYTLVFLHDGHLGVHFQHRKQTQEAEKRRLGRVSEVYLSLQLVEYSCNEACVLQDQLIKFNSHIQ